MIDSTSENPDGLSTPPCKNLFSRREGVMFINSLFSFHVTILFLTSGSGKTFPLSGIQSLPIPASGCKYIYLHLQET